MSGVSITYSETLEILHHIAYYSSNERQRPDASGQLLGTIVADLLQRLPTCGCDCCALGSSIGHPVPSHSDPLSSSQEEPHGTMQEFTKAPKSTNELYGAALVLWLVSAQLQSNKAIASRSS